MKKPSFEEFINAQDETASSLADSIEAMNVFTALSRESTIRAMIHHSEKGRPALEVCADLIEMYMDNADPDFRLSDAHAQQIINSMISTILHTYGYAPTGTTSTDRSCRRMGISEASLFHKAG